MSNWFSEYFSFGSESEADKKLSELEGFSAIKRDAGRNVEKTKLTPEENTRIAAVQAAQGLPESERKEIYKKAFPESNPAHLDKIKDDKDALELYIRTRKAALTQNLQKSSIKELKNLDFSSEGEKAAIETVKKAAEAEAQDVLSGKTSPSRAEAKLKNFVQKELGKAAKFIHQDFLIRYASNLLQYSVKRRKAANKILICDGAPRNPLGPFTKRSDGHKLLNFSTHQLSSLVPYMKFYKVNINDSGIKTKVEMPFPTTSLQLSAKGTNFLQASTPSDRTFFKNRDGFGIKSFSWVLSGQDEVNKFVDVAAKLVLYFQDFAQLVTEREHNGKKFKYLDFLLESDDLSENKKKLREQGLNYISAEIGWTVPESSSGLFSDVELDAIRANRVKLRLNLVEYQISFDETSQNSFTLDIDYRSAFEEAAKKPFLNVLNPSEETCREIAEKLEKKTELVEGKATADEISKINKELSDIYSKAKEEAFNYFTQELLKREAVFTLDVPLREIFDFSGVNPAIAKATLETADPSQQEKWNKQALSWKDEKAYDNNSEKIYFCFLGDILQIAMENALNTKKLKALNYAAPSIGKEIFAATTDVDILGSEVNLFSIPIDIRLFCQWFSETIIEANIQNRSIGVFISEFLQKIMDNKIENNIEKFTLSKEVYKSTHVQTKLTGTPLVGPQKAPDVETYFQTGDDIDYIVIYSSPKEGRDLKLPDVNDYPKSKRIDSDEFNIYHFVFGSADSIIRTANFQKTEYEFEKERRLAEGSDPYAILTNVFDVDVNMYGNALFYPGNFVYLNPSHAIGDGGRPWKKGSIFNIMGLGGYHIITGVTNDISDGIFSTSLKLKFVSTGEEK